MGHLYGVESGMSSKTLAVSSIILKWCQRIRRCADKPVKLFLWYDLSLQWAPCPKWHNIVKVQEEINCYLCRYSNGWVKNCYDFAKVPFYCILMSMIWVCFFVIWSYLTNIQGFARNVYMLNWTELKILNELSLVCHLNKFLASQEYWIHH